MPLTRPRHQRGHFAAGYKQYGSSVLGAPLVYFPASIVSDKAGLIIAGTHGDENAAMVALSCALRTLTPGTHHHHVVLAVNPDGCQFGLRANANGVDLNRNFASTNWQAGETVYRWNSQATERDVILSTGQAPASEPETQALCQLIETLQPAWIVSFHDPLGCIDDPLRSELGQWLADSFQLPLVADVGYATPGSFGSWCAEQNLPCITAEFPPISADEASERYLDAMINLLRWSVC